MPDLGSIGRKADVGYLGSVLVAYGGSWLHGVMIVARTPHVVNAVRDNAVGNPGPPSQRQDGSGMIGPEGNAIFWPIMLTGLRTLYIDVKFTPDVAPRPRIIVKANPEVGLWQDLTAQAVSGSGWQTLEVSFTATGLGVVEVWREVPSGYADAATYWDNVRVG